MITIMYDYIIVKRKTYIAILMYYIVIGIVALLIEITQNNAFRKAIVC